MLSGTIFPRGNGVIVTLLPASGISLRLLMIGSRALLSSISAS